MSGVTLQAAMKAVHDLTGKPVRVTLTKDGGWDVECYTNDEATDGDPDRHTAWVPDDGDLSGFVLRAGASARAYLDSRA